MHRDKQLKQRAWQEIEICCQTLCNKEIVMDYIMKLENELRDARKIINDLKSGNQNG